jgi:sigma-B regulation protein RsbU (phosphoserine phosphatase)
MSDLNRHLTPDMSGGRFMSMFYMLVDTDAGNVRWTSAGHDPAIVFDAGTGRFTELEGSDIALGIDSEWQYHEQGPLELRPGQIVLIGTDGIWEARNVQGEFFGKDAIRDVIREHAQAGAEDISQAIVDAVTVFRGDREQEDDLTLVVAKIGEASQASST